MLVLKATKTLTIPFTVSISKVRTSITQISLITNLQRPVNLRHYCRAEGTQNNEENHLCSGLECSQAFLDSSSAAHNYFQRCLTSVQPSTAFGGQKNPTWKCNQSSVLKTLQNTPPTSH